MVVLLYLIGPSVCLKGLDVCRVHEYVMPNGNLIHFQKSCNNMWMLSKGLDNESSLQFESVQTGVDLSISVEVLWSICSVYKLHRHEEVLPKFLRQPFRILIIGADPSTQKVFRCKMQNWK
jgi:hypothetical protein